MLRVVQWATGAVGRHAVAAMAGHPDLEVVGVLVYSDDKAGRDAGELCGIGPIGVTATKDRDQILALDADCVLYMARGEMDPAGALDEICALLASGKERHLHGGDVVHLPGERRPAGRRAPREGVRGGPRLVPRHRHRAGLGL
jgi:hypothetical protein